MVYAPVRSIISSLKQARGLPTAQVHKPCSISQSVADRCDIEVVSLSIHLSTFMSFLTLIPFLTNSMAITHQIWHLHSKIDLCLQYSTIL